ncbi:MAG: DUF692 family multinuclear iron-containing protein [Nitrospiraceae bacterium]
MSSTDQEFLRRVCDVPYHGLGLSVDVYSPDLRELRETLDAQGVTHDYLEVFKAASHALRSVREHLLTTRIAYHAEGLWITQPDFETAYPWEVELETAAEHLGILESRWLNHECAAKQMAGYSFGTYLPPLFTQASADITAENVTRVQQRLDRLCSAIGHPGALFLLETPPLTYFAFGELSMPEFFRRLTDLTPCGVVLDIGHLWTVYRYTSQWKQTSLQRFLADFLDSFPLERVVEVHLAGLASHELSQADQTPFSTSVAPPLWIDSHGAPVPEVLLEMLAQTLSHRGLRSLKAVGLEVDTKAVPQIVAEFRRLRDWCGETVKRWDRGVVSELPPRGQSSEALARPTATGSGSTEGAAELLEHYRVYARTVSGQTVACFPLTEVEPDAVAMYRQAYLPHEILVWGGDVREMFPETWHHLDRADIPLNAFFAYWFREPRTSTSPYDFFLLKLERFSDFVDEILPEAAGIARREAEELRVGYQCANEQIERESRSHDQDKEVVS